MNKLEPRLECSQELLQLLKSNPKDSCIWDKIQRALFMFCGEVSKEETFLAFIYGQGILQENPFQLRRQYEDPVLRIHYALDTVCQERALQELLIALEKSGNEAIIAEVLQHVRGPQNEEAAAITTDVTETHGTNSLILKTETDDAFRMESEITIVSEQLTDFSSTSSNQSSHSDQVVNAQENPRQVLNVMTLGSQTSSANVEDKPELSRESELVSSLPQSSPPPSPTFQCPHPPCKKSFKLKSDCRRHAKRCHSLQYCDLCRKYKPKENFERHQTNCAIRFDKPQCMKCGRWFRNAQGVANHRRHCRNTEAMT